MKDIFLDFDYPFGEWVRSVRFNHTIRKLKRMYQEIDHVRMRESSSGNTHVWIRFNKDVYPLDHFMIRAALDDDRDRVYNDLKRLYWKGDESKINRCFDAKVKPGSISRAGDWIEFRLLGVA